MASQSQQDEQTQSRRFLEMVDAECRRWGGKHLLTAEEYLNIVNRVAARVYTEQDADFEKPASV